MHSLKVVRGKGHYFISPWHAGTSVILKPQKHYKERKTCISVSSTACDIYEQNVFSSAATLYFSEFCILCETYFQNTK